MNEVMKTILHRRSIRRFKAEQIKEEELEQIMKAGEYAPCAGSRQSPLFAVCQDPALNDEIGKINYEKLREIINVRPPEKAGDSSGKAPAMKLNEGAHNIFNGAPTVITIFAPKNWYNFIVDAAVAGENMMICADSLGIGSCMIARAQETFETERGQELMRQWGISDEYEAKIHIMFGYPEGEHPEPKPRRDGRIIRI